MAKNKKSFFGYLLPHSAWSSCHPRAKVLQVLKTIQDIFFLQYIFFRILRDTTVQNRWTAFDILQIYDICEKSHEICQRSSTVFMIFQNFGSSWSTEIINFCALNNEDHERIIMENSGFSLERYFHSDVNGWFSTLLKMSGGGAFWANFAAKSLKSKLEKVEKLNYNLKFLSIYAHMRLKSIIIRFQLWLVSHCAPSGHSGLTINYVRPCHLRVMRVSEYSSHVSATGHSGGRRASSVDAASLPLQVEKGHHPRRQRPQRKQGLRSSRQSRYCQKHSGDLTF